MFSRNPHTPYEIAGFFCGCDTEWIFLQRVTAWPMLLAAMILCLLGQQVENAPLADRRYDDGERLSYRMVGNNQNWSYDVQATGVVQKDDQGIFVESFAWSNLLSEGVPFPLGPKSLEFRQTLSLDPKKVPAMPDFTAIHPILVQPVRDLVIFYADLWLAKRLGSLKAPGDTAYYPYGRPHSWADGNRVVLGEDSIDFSMTLRSVDNARKIATLVVRHIPPKEPQVKLPAAWMLQPASDTPNNWVNVVHEGAMYNASAGQETFDVTIEVSMTDGKILSGILNNRVNAIRRDCTDAALTDCGPARRERIKREVRLTLDR